MATATSVEDFAVPKFLEGGCLCGSLRYRVDFPEDHDFKKSVGLSNAVLRTLPLTLCTQTELHLPMHRMPQAVRFTRLAPPPAKAGKRAHVDVSGHQEDLPRQVRTVSAPSARTAAAGSRGNQPKARVSSSAIGTVDQIYLVGTGVETVRTGAYEGHDEQQIIPAKGFGFALANGCGTHFWAENEIQGITDNIVRGQKLLRQERP